MAPRTARTPKKKRRDWKPVWLLAFRNTGTVTGACAAAKIGRQTAYDARNADESFAASWDEVEAETTEAMEREAYRRAVEGADGKYSDTLLIFLLKARKPEMYRENVRVEHSGPDGDPIHVMIPTDEQHAREVAEILAETGAVGRPNGNGNGATNGTH